MTSNEDKKSDLLKCLVYGVTPLSTIFQLYGGGLKWQYIEIVNRFLETNFILYGRIYFFLTITTFE